MAEVRAKCRAFGVAFLLLFLLSLVPCIAEDKKEPWEGFSLSVDYDVLVNGYNEKYLEMPEEMLKALDDERVVFFFYKAKEQVQSGGTRTIVTTHSVVFLEGKIIKHTTVEFPEPTLYVYMTEQGFYEFVTGERSLRELSREKSVRYDAVGLGDSLRLSWLKFKYWWRHRSKEDRTFELYVPLQTSLAREQPSLREVSHCASAGAANVMVKQRLTVKNCTGCAIEYLQDRCLDSFTLLEVSCGEEGTLREEVVDCGELSRICSNGACSRDTSQATNLEGFTASERVLALSSKGLECYESDSGKTPGEAGALFLGDEQFEDFCLSSGRLMEYWCSADSLKSEEVSCADTVCFHGACRAASEVLGTGSLDEILSMEDEWLSGQELCSDSDGSDVFETRGTVTVKNCPTCAAASHADVCFTSAIIIEQYCTGRQRRERYANCQDFGYEYCDAGRCTSSPGSDATRMRNEEQMSAESYFAVVNRTGVKCKKQRTAFSLFPGDARDRLFYKACDTCNYTVYQEDCYKGKVYEFDCASPDGPPTVVAQSCPGRELCYWGRCEERKNLNDSAYLFETERHEAIDALPNCVDTDLGIDPRTKGRVEITDCPFCPAKTENHIYWDTCASGTAVNEQYCEKGIRQTKKKDCAGSGRVCVDGACVFP